jgi:pyruvate-ferredoxin/flavodoxin oxidoreductase
LQAISYGNVYVARIAMGANPQQTLLAFREAEAYDGPSLILAYSHCIAHGINMQRGLDQQHLAVECGHWPLFRYNPAGTRFQRKSVCSRFRAAQDSAQEVRL